MEWIEFSVRMGFAVLFGFLIGVERQLTGHSVGIRINVLVSVGSCMFVLFPLVIGAGEETRVAAQIVSGVGFLCSAIIFKDGLSVRGLNTAATIWCTAAIGVLTSSGQIAISAIATGILLVVNLSFRKLSHLIRPLDFFDESEHCYIVSVVCDATQQFGLRSMILNWFRDSKLVVTRMESIDADNHQVEISVTLMCYGKRKDDMAEALVAKIAAEQGVSETDWKFLG